MDVEEAVEGPIVPYELHASDSSPPEEEGYFAPFKLCALLTANTEEESEH